MNNVAAIEMQEIAKQHKREVESGKRFEFGKNWSAFLEHLSEDRILRAEQSLREMLEVETLTGKTFLDIGSGSGLFSLRRVVWERKFFHSISIQIPMPARKN